VSANKPEPTSVSETDIWPCAECGEMLERDRLDPFTGKCSDCDYEEGSR
jgi:hypothetical protein